MWPPTPYEKGPVPVAGPHFSRACLVCNSVSVRTTLAHATCPRPATTTAKAEQTSFSRRTWPSFTKTIPNYSANASRNWKQPFGTNSRSRASGRNAWAWCRIKSHATNVSRIRTTPTTPERVSIGYRAPVVTSVTAFALVCKRPCQNTLPPASKTSCPIIKTKKTPLKKTSDRLSAVIVHSTHLGIHSLHHWRSWRRRRGGHPGTKHGDALSHRRRTVPSCATRYPHRLPLWFASSPARHGRNGTDGRPRLVIGAVWRHDRTIA